MTPNRSPKHHHYLQKHERGVMKIHTHTHTHTRPGYVALPLQCEKPEHSSKRVRPELSPNCCRPAIRSLLQLLQTARRRCCCNGPSGSLGREAPYPVRRAVYQLSVRTWFTLAVITSGRAKWTLIGARAGLPCRIDDLRADHDHQVYHTHHADPDPHGDHGHANW